MGLTPPSTPVIYALAGFGHLLPLILVPLRCVARLRVVHRLAAEDYLMIIAEILNLAMGSQSFAIAYFGAGKRYSELTPQVIETGLKIWWVAMMLYPIVATLIKMSIALLLLRLMSREWQKAVVYIVMALTIAVNVMALGYSAGFCIPISAFWHRELDRCNLSGLEIVLYVQSAVAVATDVALAILPALVLARSALPRKQKIATAGVLAIGTGAGLATAVRLGFTSTVVNGDDFLYSSVWLGLASSLEISLAITAGCLATFRPFFVKMQGRPMRPVDSIGAAGQLSLHDAACTIRGNWDPGLTIDIEQSNHADDINVIPRSISRSDSDFSLPIQRPEDADKDDREAFKGPIYVGELKI